MPNCLLVVGKYRPVRRKCVVKLAPGYMLRSSHGCTLLYRCTPNPVIRAAVSSPTEGCFDRRQVVIMNPQWSHTAPFAAFVRLFSWR